MSEERAEYTVPLPPLPESPRLYWKREPGKTDNNETALYHGVGVCLSIWEGLENEFAILFRIFCESHTFAASRAYGAIASHSGRREALENAAEVYFHHAKTPPDHQAYFKTLMAHFREASARRNEIAHAIVTSISIDNAPHEVFLIPADYNSRKTDAFPGDWEKDRYALFKIGYRYSTDDVLYFRNGFSLLRHAVNAFYDALRGAKK
jgi:hypothetical protein